MKKVLAIAAGGYSDEAEISLLSANTVLDNIDLDKFEPILVRILSNKWEAEYKGSHYLIDKNDFSFQTKERKITFDFVYIIIHGTPGEDGKLQAYFDLLAIPYSSPNHPSSTLTFNKWHCNTILRQLGYNVAASIYLRENQKYKEQSIVDKLGLPFFVKPCSAGSSYGVTKVSKTEDLKAAVEYAFQYDEEILIESELKGREITCGVYQNLDHDVIALPITEIIPEGEFFDFAAKYQGASQEITPAKISEKARVNTQETAKKVYQQLNLRGINRIDFMLVDEVPYIIEINTIPGMTKGSLVPQQIEAAHIKLEDFFSEIIEGILKK